MATILRTWSYQHQWFYDTVTRLSALAVGGEKRFRHLALQGLEINSNTEVLDLCCGAAPVTQYLVQYSNKVTALDASPVALQRAADKAPEANYVEGLAQEMPFPNNQFDLVHTSVALHEMNPQELTEILQEVYRVLKPGGIFTLVDFHKPTNPLFVPGLAVFMWLFETETAWQLLKTDLVEKLQQLGFTIKQQKLHAGGSLQVIQAQK